jgi:sulfite exporter TauE/SafE/copper chaperone CopZ/plastocyanin domain-containing protein
MQKSFFVEGMTCSSCEARIEKALRKLDGVSEARASLKDGTAWVEFDEARVGSAAIKAAIEKGGYLVKDRKGRAGTMIALGVGVLLSASYLIASQAGVFNGLPKVDASIGYGMLFVVGLLTSFHCVAMCGGIALSQSIESNAKPSLATESRLSRLIPGLLYNGGRVLSYTIVGGLVGTLGSAFNFSPLVKGLIAGAAGAFMVLLGLKMLGILSKMPQPGRILPASFRNAFQSFTSAFRKRGPFAVGILNGLMPCGPLQTMQLYALGTGSILAGAFSMFIFSAGTVPLMLVFGAVAAFLPRNILPVIVRASAVLVMFLGIMTFSRAAALAGIDLPDLTFPSLSAGLGAGTTAQRSALLIPVTGGSGGGPVSRAGFVSAVLQGGVQTVLTEFGPNGYVPFVVQAGIPVKWTIRVSADNLNGCNNPIQIPAYDVRKTLVPGDNLIEFTPTKEGSISYSCWMGMIRSRITAVSDLARIDSLPQDQRDALVAPLPNQGSGGCCSGSSNAAFAGGKVPTDKIGIPTIVDGIQVIEVTVDGQGYSPAALVLQKGMKAIIRFKPEQLSSCNNPVIFPEYNGGLDLAKGQLETPAIPITADFTFQCGMGMLHGYVKTVDDLATVDIAKIKAEIGKYKAAGGGGCCGS